LLQPVAPITKQRAGIAVAGPTPRRIETG
jgi:hypothetical protein